MSRFLLNNISRFSTASAWRKPTLLSLSATKQLPLPPQVLSPPYQRWSPQSVEGLSDTAHRHQTMLAHSEAALLPVRPETSQGTEEQRHRTAGSDRDGAPGQARALSHPVLPCALCTDTALKETALQPGRRSQQRALGEQQGSEIQMSNKFQK